MAQTRALPITAKHREFTVKVNGQAVPRALHLLSVTVTKSVNKIAAARLVYMDGVAAQGDFPQSNDDLWLPGKTIEISAGSSEEQTALFAGVIVRHGLKVREGVSPQLIIECRHAAVALSVSPRSASYFDSTDGEIMESLLKRGGIDHRIEGARLKHAQLVQFRSTDWEFLLARAEANGLVVTTNERVLRALSPAAGKSVCTLQYGASLLELDTEIDARSQYDSVSTVSWDSAQQALVTQAAQAPATSGPGNVAPDDLALAGWELRHASVDDAEALSWASSRWLWSRLNKTSGRAKCEGIGNINPTDTITLLGAGKRFSGDVYVTGVRHEFDLVQGWKTHVQFGGIEPGTGQRMRDPLEGLLATVHGLQIGVVVGNEDPAGEHRVRVRLPLVNGQDDGVWARVACLDAGKERGTFFRPELGDEVVVGFLEGDARHAVLLGMLHSSAHPAPLKGSDDNHEKVIRTRSGMRVYFEDDKKLLEMSTPAGNKLVLSEQDKHVLLQDQNGNRIELSPDGIVIQSAKALELKAGTDIKLKAGGMLGAEASTSLEVNCAATVKLSAAAAAIIKGNPLMLN